MNIPKKTQKMVEKYKKDVEKAIVDGALKIARTRGLELINRFQSRIKIPIYLAYNVDSWITDIKHEDRRRFVDLWDAVECAARKESLPTGFNFKRRYELYARAFPELVELAWIVEEVDKLGAGMGAIKPTVKPMGTKKTK